MNIIVKFIITIYNFFINLFFYGKKVICREDKDITVKKVSDIKLLIKIGYFTKHEKDFFLKVLHKLYFNINKINYYIILLRHVKHGEPLAVILSNALKRTKNISSENRRILLKKTVHVLITYFK